MRKDLDSPFYWGDYDYEFEELEKCFPLKFLKYSIGYSVAILSLLDLSLRKYFERKSCPN